MSSKPARENIRQHHMGRIWAKIQKTSIRAIMIKFGQQLRDNAQGEITMTDFEKAWRIQRTELSLPTEIGQEEVTVKDSYEGVNDEELFCNLRL